ncbi:MAG: hypothetical protein KAI79_04330 [Bacteroidales bacterium]|nr:hypothetical protein [Bacteroidales bacterium]
MNLSNEKGLFKQNYFTIFGMKLPHMDTVALFMEKSDPVSIDAIKYKMLQVLISKKVFRKFLLSGYYTVAIDGTGISSYNYEPWEGCPYKTYKSGKTVWQVPILEAKLVFYNGFSISLCTEWILNIGEYHKQNCEQKAFKALAAKIKKQFPRLPIVILADGLYPNDTFFLICENNNWQHITTIKDGNLKTFWEQIEWELRISKENPQERILKNKSEYRLKQIFRFINGQKYKKHILNWIECVEKETRKEKISQTRFVYVTNIKATKENIYSLCQYGRKRWNIENEGFDEQKNHGYAVKHKYSRKSLVARQNYYQCLQIAHLINQLVEKSKKFISQLYLKETIQNLWDCMIAFLWLGTITETEMSEIHLSNCQIRY